jgi:purine-binding chemotaxis protein CheW
METDILTNSDSSRNITTEKTCQYSTFFIDEMQYGIDVMKVQEITRPMAMTDVPLAPPYVRGLINLRGQIAIAIKLRTLFGVKTNEPSELMNVVCRVDGLLLTFLIDRVGDVVELQENLSEQVPETVEPSVRQYLEGVYKTTGGILSIINVEKLVSAVNQSENNQS